MTTAMEGSSPVSDMVSVVLATHNGERYLGEQLASLAAQQLLPGELIVGDDASSDATLEILNEFARSSPFPVRLVKRGEPLGYGDNFMRTAQLAGGSLIAFCDQDDIWRPAKLRVVVDAFRQSQDTVAVAHQFDLIDSAGSPIRQRPSCIFAPGGPWPFGFAMTVRRTLLDSLRHVSWPFRSDSTGPGHDTWLWMVAEFIGGSVILKDPLVSYRLHSGNLHAHHALDAMAAPRRWSERVSLVLRPEKAADIWSSLVPHMRAEAEYVELLTSGWERDGHEEWARRGRVYSESLYEGIQLLTQRESLLRIRGRSTAVRRLCNMVRSGTYERRQQAIADGLRVAIGPKVPDPVRGGNATRSRTAS